LRNAYLGHKRLFIIGNENNFEVKISDTIDSVLSVLGIPNKKHGFRKFLLDNSGLKFEYDRYNHEENPHYQNYHVNLFGREVFDDLNYVTKVIKHSCLHAP